MIVNLFPIDPFGYQTPFFGGHLLGVIFQSCGQSFPCLRLYRSLPLPANGFHHVIRYWSSFNGALLNAGPIMECRSSLIVSRPSSLPSNIIITPSLPSCWGDSVLTHNVFSEKQALTFVYATSKLIYWLSNSHIRSSELFPLMLMLCEVRVEEWISKKKLMPPFPSAPIVTRPFCYG